MGRNEQCRSGTTQSFFLVQLSFITSVAMIFHKKKLHDKNTLLITSLFEHLIQIRDNMCLRSINDAKYAYPRAYDSNNPEELCHNKCLAEITIVIFNRVSRRVLSRVLRAISHRFSIDLILVIRYWFNESTSPNGTASGLNKLN